MQKSLEVERQVPGQGKAPACQTLRHCCERSRESPEWMSFRKLPVTSVLGELCAPGVSPSPGALIIGVAMRN